MRAVLGIISGVAAAIVAFVAIGVIGVGMTYAPPAGIDLADSNRVVELFLAMPTAPKVAMLVAVFGAAVAGAAVARLIARRIWPAWVVTALIASYVGLSILSLPLSGLAQTLCIVAPLIGGLLGSHLFSARADRVAVSEG